MEKIRIHPIPTEIVEPALICLPFIPETPITIFFVYFVCYILYVGIKCSIHRDAFTTSALIRYVPNTKKSSWMSNRESPLNNS